MKRTLSVYISAITAALAVAAIQPAVAATPNGPTVYGKINVSLDKFDNEGSARVIAGSSATEVDQWELNSNASRLGVKGDLALDGTGLTVVYQAEYGIDVDDGNTTFTQRNIFIGLQGNFGRLIAGKHDTPLKLIEGKFDQFNDLRADIDVLAGGHNRASNIVQYFSPKFANGLLTASVGFILPEGADVDLDGEPDDGLTDNVSASLVADTGTYYGALAYSGNEAASRSVDGIIRADIIRAVGTTKIGAFELGALLQQSKDVAPGSDRKDDTFILSAGWNIDKYKVKAQYGLSKGKVTDEEGTLAALGLDYALGGKTRVYTYFSTLDLDKADRRDDTFAVGFDHSF